MEMTLEIILYPELSLENDAHFLMQTGDQFSIVIINLLHKDLQFDHIWLTAPWQPLTEYKEWMAYT